MTGNTRLAPNATAVIGGGVVGMLAAIALRRALPRTAMTLVEVPVPAGALADRFPLVRPADRPFLDGIGIGDDLLIERGDATPVLGSTFTGFAARPFTITHGECVRQLLGAPLHVLALAHGRGHALPDMSLAAALIAAGRFMDEAQGAAGPLAGTDNALRLAPTALAPYLERAGVRRIPSPHLAADYRDGLVTGLSLHGGATLTADLYVDASGPARLLSPGRVETWDDVAPSGSTWHRSGTARAAPADRYVARHLGWQVLWSRPGGVDELIVGREPTPTSDGFEEIPLAPGRLVLPMAGNVVAIGDAAISPGPMLGLGLSCACRGLELLLDLLPAARPEPQLAQEYNRRLALLSGDVRDLLAAVQLRASSGAGTQSSALARFRRAGRLPRREDGTIADAEWVQLLLGLGVVPERADAVACSVPRAEAAAALDALSGAVAALCEEAPTYEQWIGRWRAHRP